MKLAVQFGAGGIGRGFLGQLLSESGYEVLFVDVDRDLVSALNARGGYPLRLVGDRNETLIIKRVSALMADESEAVAKAINRAAFVCTASGVLALPAISELLALGLNKRRQSGAGPVNIVICENLNRADKHLRELIEKHPCCPENDYLDENVGFVQSVVARMVPVRTAEVLAEDSLLVLAESYPFLPVDAAAMRGDIPGVKGLIPAKNFQGYVDRKLYIHNAMHAICGYMGYAKGYEFVWEAVEDSEIAKTVQKAMSAVCRALSIKHSLDPVGLAENVYDLLRRFRCRELADTVARVAGDPLRKLSGPGGRLIGAAELCLSEGIEPNEIVQGIALGLGYDNRADESAVRLQEMIASKGLEAVLQEVCGLSRQQRLWGLILSAYERISSK